MATQPTLGQDGTLADDFTVDTFDLHRSDAYPTQYSATPYLPEYSWPSKPGVYYYQVHSIGKSRLDPTTGHLVLPVGSVRKLVVTAPPAPPVQLGVAEGAGVARSVLKKKFGSRYPGAQRVTVKYTRISATTINYRVSWTKRGAKFAGTVKVRETATNYIYSINVGRR